jgi:diacylglycerol O-acyltransferase / wax synthase
MGRSRVDRLSSTDASYLGADHLPRPWHVAAVLRIDGGALPKGLDVDLLRAEFDSRSRSVARLRQGLRRPPFGFGRPYWVDDADFRIERHVDLVTAPPGCDRDGMFALAEDVLTYRFDYRHPPWKLVFVDGLETGDIGLIVVLDHALADGLAGIALMTALLDPGPTAIDQWEPAPPPDLIDIAADRVARLSKALLGVLRLLVHPIRTLRSWREAWDVLLAGGSSEETTLNRPTGVSRRLVAVEADLEGFHAMARGAGGTINDAVLAAVAAGLDRLLAGRGEALDLLYASIPVGLRDAGSADEMGNRVAGMRVPLRMGAGTFSSRIAQVARFTRSHKAFRLDPAAVGLFGALRDLLGSAVGYWYSQRQRLVNVFVTNMVGPPKPLSLLGADVLQVVPIAPISGNVPIAVGVLSYAETLTVSVNADPEVVPDLDAFIDGLRDAMARQEVAPQTAGVPAG